MSFSELDVQEVLEGFPPPGAMTRGSRVEVVRRLDAQLHEALSRPVLAKMLGVSTRTIERYRRELRDDTLS